MGRFQHNETRTERTNTERHSTQHTQTTHANNTRKQHTQTTHANTTHTNNTHEQLNSTPKTKQPRQGRPRRPGLLPLGGQRARGRRRDDVQPGARRGLPPRQLPALDRRQEGRRGLDLHADGAPRARAADGQSGLWTVVTRYEIWHFWTGTGTFGHTPNT